SRIYGFGSVYAKTIRDSRLAFLIAAGLMGGLALALGGAIPTVFPTPQSRLEIDQLIGGMPPTSCSISRRLCGVGKTVGIAPPSASASPPIRPAAMRNASRESRIVLA